MVVDLFINNAGSARPERHYEDYGTDPLRLLRRFTIIGLTVCAVAFSVHRLLASCNCRSRILSGRHPHSTSEKIIDYFST